jgi:porin
VLLALLTFAAVQAPPDPQDFWSRDTLLPDWGNVRHDLADHGIRWTLEFTGEVLSAVSGGADQDTGADLLLDWVIDADFDKLLGWTGGSGRINPLWLAGDGIDSNVGDLTRISNITGKGDVRVFEAWLQQTLYENTFSLRAGIMGADQEFAISQTGLLYFNSSFGAPVFLSANLAWPIYPVGALGARIRCELGSGVYLMGGVYDGDSGSEEFNRSGFRIRLTHGDGLFSIGGIGWIFGGDLPGLLKLGGFYHDADFLNFKTGHDDAGFGGAYVVFERKIYKEGPIPGELDVHFRLGFAQEDRAFVDAALDASANFTGVIPGRDNDVIGLGWIYARIGRDFANTQPNPGPWSYESVIEVTYRFVVTPALNFQPDFQYLLHPGGTSSTPNATVVGIRVDIKF